MGVGEEDVVGVGEVGDVTSCRWGGCGRCR